MTPARRDPATDPAPHSGAPPSLVGLTLGDATLPSGRLLDRVARGGRELDPETTAAGEFLAAL